MISEVVLGSSRISQIWPTENDAGCTLTIPLPSCSAGPMVKAFGMPTNFVGDMSYATVGGNEGLQPAPIQFGSTKANR